MFNFFSRGHKNAAKSTSIKSGLFSKLAGILHGKQLSAELVVQLETQLISADISLETTQIIISQLKEQAKTSKLDARELLAEILVNLLSSNNSSFEITDAKPHVIMMVGINGVGKTTTSAKLAHLLQKKNKKIMLAAADTFRAAAIEQLQAWGNKLKIPVVAQQIGSDSSAVLFDALESAQAKQADVLIADTAGRLQNKTDLMQQLEKNIRVLKKIDPSAPHSICVVVDANNGQNLINQVEEFKRILDVTHIICTKYDSSAKAGALISLAIRTNIPISFLGTGENIGDLASFDVEEFIKDLLA
jgi:fused signal recognition particle receptor